MRAPRKLANRVLGWAAFKLISPPNFCGGGGMYRPSMVVAASGDPGMAVRCWAGAAVVATAVAATPNPNRRRVKPLRAHF